MMTPPYIANELQVRVGGFDVRQLTTASLRGAIGKVPQVSEGGRQEGGGMAGAVGA